MLVSGPEKLPGARGCGLILTEGELPRFRNSGNVEMSELLS